MEDIFLINILGKKFLFAQQLINSLYIFVKTWGMSKEFQGKNENTIKTLPTYYTEFKTFHVHFWLNWSYIGYGNNETESVPNVLKISKMAEIIVETISKLTLNFIIYKLVLNSKWYLPSFNSNDFLKLIHFQWGEMVLKCHRTNNTVTFNFTSYIKIWELNF